jgi:hypothetical protein
VEQLLTAVVGVVAFVVPATAADLPRQSAQPTSATPPVLDSFFHDASGAHGVRASESEFVVKARPVPQRAVGARPASWPAAHTPEGLSEVAARLESRLAGRDLFVVRGLDAAQARQLDGAAYALPVLYRQGGHIPIYQTDRIVLRLKDGADEAALREYAEKNGSALAAAPRGAGRYYLTVRDPHANAPLVVANALHARKELVDYAHPDFFLPMVTYAPPVIDDPLYLSLQWHLDGDFSKGAQPNSDINAEAAWDTDHGLDAEGVSSVRVSILDECVEKLHPDLFPNWAAGLDVDQEPFDDDPSPDAGQRHGTACAGIAVAKGNSIGVRGACPNCGLIGVKFFGGSIADTATGFYFSVDPDDNGDHSDGAAVLSNSWGYADGVFAPADVVASINFAANSGRNGKGCLVLFASANNDHTVNGVSALAQLPTVMAVGGTNSNAVHTEFSDVGPEVGITTPTNDRGDDGVRFSWLDTTTTDNTGTSGYNGLPNDPDYTNMFGGTSSATPLAAGVLGLIISQDPSMTAAQARAILQHTAVHVDEPYGRFDPITGHSHRFGFGRADAGQAVAAADAGTRWPDRIKTLTAAAAGSDVSLSWSAPLNDYAESLLVRSEAPFGWAPTDGQTYLVGQEVASGADVIYAGAVTTHVDVGADDGGFFYAVFPRSAANRYGFGARAHLFRNSTNLFYDNSEGPDPGWTHGGTNDEWQRGLPTSSNVSFAQAVAGSGPLSGTIGARAIGGNRCWGTDLTYTYDPDTDAYLQTPFVNLTGVAGPVYLEYYDWCMLETFYDTCRIEVVNADEELLGVLDPDTGGDYDWTRRAYDLSSFAGQVIAVRFRLISDGLFNRDGWFIDEARIVVTGQANLPPVAKQRLADTTENVTAAVVLAATDPNIGDPLSFVISSLPAQGSLTDPNAGAINGVPYTLAAGGTIVHYAPDTDYQGADAFAYHAFDGELNSNVADVKLTVGTPVMIVNFPLDANPGFFTEGEWAFGQPGGAGGDPPTGFSGLNVYGYRLGVEYPDNLSVKYLTMPPQNCSGLSRVTLKFARWLGVENASFDKATIQVSTDGANWSTVFTNPFGADLDETSWSQQSYNLGPFVDDAPFVLIRWGMGPTDTNTTYSGWNIDDISIWAIGTPDGNLPPFAKNVSASTALNVPVDVVLDADDADLDPLSYTILSLPANGSLADPNAGPIAAAPYTLAANGDLVQYLPNMGFDLTDTFMYRADDGQTSSNAATAAITVLNPVAFPFTETFEAGPPLGSFWQLHSTNTGRIQISPAEGPVGAFHAIMDSSSASSASLNELTLIANLDGAANVLLRYSWKEFSDESNVLPASWTGSADGDGVAISDDGVAWHKIADLIDGSGTYQTVTIDLDDAATTAGINYNSTFRIRFQQFDDQPITSDGIALDDIMLIQGTGDPQITTGTLPDGEMGQPYGPVILQAIGGDLPLEWILLNDVYGEDSLGESLFAAGGVGQGWIADDAAFDYALPFAFPFYDEMHTNVKIATDGWINFGAFVGATYTNSEALLAANKRIAVMWDDLKTNVIGGDIFIDESVAGQVTIRWQGTVRANATPCNFSCTLFDDGRIQIDYGSGNAGLTPTVGVSFGDSATYTLLSYDAATALTDADSIEAQRSQLPPGIVLSTGGELTGMPTDTGLYKPIFHIQDQSARTDTRKISLLVPGGLFGDFDGDLDVDDADFDSFRLCYTGADNGPVAPGCEAGDGDGDGDIDCLDWREFRAAFVDSSAYTPAMPIDDFVAVLMEDPDVTALDQCLADTDDNDVNNAADIQLLIDAILGAP